jgi:hypothetical protein
MATGRADDDNLLYEIVKTQFVEFLQTFRTSPNTEDLAHYEQKVLQMRHSDRRTLYIKHAHIFFVKNGAEDDHSPPMSFDRSRLSQVILEHYHKLVPVLKQAVDMFIRLEGDFVKFSDILADVLVFNS